jgi:hypothetical protein
VFLERLGEGCRRRSAHASRRRVYGRCLNSMPIGQIKPGACSRGRIHVKEVWLCRYKKSK